MYNEKKYVCPKDCPDRKVTADYNCHSHCERHLRYQLTQRLKRKIRFKLYEQLQAEYDAKHNVRKIALRYERNDRARGVKNK